MINIERVFQKLMSIFSTKGMYRATFVVSGRDLACQQEISLVLAQTPPKFKPLQDDG